MTLEAPGFAMRPTPAPTHRLRPYGWSLAALLLALPAVAMRFTDEVQWTALDFVVFGGLLLVTGLALEAIARWIRSPRHRMGLASLALLAFLLAWAQGAVGLI